MKLIFSKRCLPAICLSILLSPGAVAEVNIAEFDAEENDRLNWKVVNDGVMGGLSRGKVSFTDEGVMDFSGKISLKNNGGFSLVETGNTELDLSSADGLEMKVKGDGRTYQVRLATDAKFRGREMSFAAEFPTSEGKWTTVKVPFDKLVGTFRGMTLRKAEFDPAKVRRVGLLAGDKKAGPFSIQVDWIRTYEAGD